MEKKEKREYIRKLSIYIFLAENKRLLAFAFLFGGPLAVSFVLGWRLVLRGTVFGSGNTIFALAGNFLLFLLETVCLAIPATVFAALVLRGRQRKDEGKSGGRDSRRLGRADNKRPAWQIWLFHGAVIFLCWIPVFLAYYPSVFAYDAEGQLYQVIAGDYSTHHPLLHTLFLGAFFRLGGALGSYSLGMAIHSIAQMLLMAVSFGWVLSYLYQRRTPRWLRILLLIFYAVFPANSVLALSTTKDVLFSALVLLSTVCFYQMACDGNLWIDRRKRGACIFFAVLMLLFRNNAVYAFAAGVPVSYMCLGKRRQDTEAQNGGGRALRKGYLRMTLLILVLFGVCSFVLKAVTHAQSGSPREMLSVPLQQMARTRVAAEEEIEPSLRQELEKFLSSEWVFAAYDPHLADPVKNRAVIHDDPAGLIRTWIQLGLGHPAIYVDAFLDNSLGLWFLQDTSHAQVYGIGTESGFGYLSTDNRTMPAGCEIVEHSFLPSLRSFMEKIVSDNEYNKIPVVRILFSPALYCWMLYFYIVAALYEKRYRELFPAVFLAAYYLTLLFSPTVLVRYSYPLMVTVPAILACFAFGENSEKSENIQQIIKRKENFV